MQLRRTVSPLAIVLPHPSLPTRRSSLLSTSSSSPRTPRSCGSPSCSSLYFTSSNRLSSDSWNSSNHDLEDLEIDWKPEQVLLLQRTLNALPAHLVTPFNGAIPPSNLLDKIARGVAERKGPAEWPHSLRATRLKLIEICRARATEDDQRRIVTDENDDPEGAGRGKRSTGIRRLYRQSSMDFIGAATPSGKDNASISRLSTRLQRTDRIILDPSLPSYSRTRAHTQALHRRSLSPPHATQIPSLINPSTSSSTLSSLYTTDHSRVLRRSASTLATSDSPMSNRSSANCDNDVPAGLLPSSMPMAPDSRAQRIRRSESFCGTASKDTAPFLSSSSATPAPVRQGFKRAPSFGTLAQDAKARGQSYTYSSSAEDLAYTFDPSSDEEEKLRTRLAKKPRTRNDKELPPIPTSTKAGPRTKVPKGSAKTTKSSSTSASRDSGVVTGTKSSSTNQRPVRRMPLQRTSRAYESKDLPHLHIPSSLSQEQILETPLASPTSSTPSLPNPPAVMPAGRVRTLRRMRRLPSRRISFGSLTAPPGEDADAEGENEDFELGSAFQLH